MRASSSLLFMTTFLVFLLIHLPANAQHDEVEQKEDALQGTIPGMEIENIMTSPLESAEGKEVIVSHLVVPPNTTFPKHWHPGEEFIYVLEGTAIVWQEGKPETLLNEGDIFKVSLKQIHTAKTGEVGATVLVFRVHETGQPVRVNIEE